MLMTDLMFSLKKKKKKGSRPVATYSQETPEGRAAMNREPLKLFDDAVLLDQMARRPRHGNDVVRDPAHGRTPSVVR